MPATFWPPAFLVAEAEEELEGVALAAVADVVVAETATLLVAEEATEEAEEVLDADEPEDPEEPADEVAPAVALLDTQLTASGTVTPAVLQICCAYCTAVV